MSALRQKYGAAKRKSSTQTLPQSIFYHKLMKRAGCDTLPYTLSAQIWLKDISQGIVKGSEYMASHNNKISQTQNFGYPAEKIHQKESTAF